MIYLYKSGQFSNTCLMHALNENGTLEGVFEFGYPKKAYEVLSKWPGFEELELVEKPWSHEGLKAAKDNHLAIYGIELK